MPSSHLPVLLFHFAFSLFDSVILLIGINEYCNTDAFISVLISTFPVIFWPWINQSDRNTNVAYMIVEKFDCK